MSNEEYFYIIRKERTSDEDGEFIRKMYGEQFYISMKNNAILMHFFILPH